PNGEANGLFGVLESVPSAQSVPEPSSMVLGLTAVGLLVGRWTWKNRKRRVTACGENPLRSCTPPALRFVRREDMLGIGVCPPRKEGCFPGANQCGHSDRRAEVPRPNSAIGGLTACRSGDGPPPNHSPAYARFGHRSGFLSTRLSPPVRERFYLSNS